MEITEVRIKLVEKNTERLRAFCSITLDGDFVIRDLKIIDGTNGVFVAMPSRKLMDRCPRCGAKNHLRARFCNECGARLSEDRAPRDAQGRGKLHADVAHPINAACRERLQNAVVHAYQVELEKSKSPDYRPAKYDEYEGFEDFEESHGSNSAGQAAKPPAPKAQPAPESHRREPRPAVEARQEFGGYNDLIADLKREASDRRREGHHDDDHHGAPDSSRTKATGIDRNFLREHNPAFDAPAPQPAGTPAKPAPPGPPAGKPPKASEDFGAGL